MTDKLIPYFKKKTLYMREGKKRNLPDSILPRNLDVFKMKQSVDLYDGWS